MLIDLEANGIVIMLFDTFRLPKSLILIIFAIFYSN